VPQMILAERRVTPIMGMKDEARMKRCKGLGVLLVCLLTLSAGCIPEFSNPLPGSEADSRLLGAWSGREENGSRNELLFFSRPLDWMDVLFLTDVGSESSSNGLDSAVYEGYATSVKNEKFLCLRLRGKDVADKRDRPTELNYMIVHYRVVSNDCLEVRMLSEDKFADLVNTGLLAGVVGTNLSSGGVTITASGETLKSVLAKLPLSEYVNVSEDPMRFSRWKAIEP
jgi:hypothetical protein